MRYCNRKEFVRHVLVQHHLNVNELCTKKLTRDVGFSKNTLHADCRMDTPSGPQSNEIVETYKFHK